MNSKTKTKECPMCGSSMVIRRLERTKESVWFCMKADARCAYCENASSGEIGKQ